MNFIEELSWRGMIYDVMPGTAERLSRHSVTGYIGFDPTADSLHVGSLSQIMTLMHFQRAGHKPIALVGGATGMIGDPSGKLQERKLLSVDDIRHNETCIQKQLQKFLDFERVGNKAEIVNNYDWFKSIYTIEFLRDVGKFLTISYLLNKGFVKDRLANEQDLSFTEFNYILMQAFDFLWLFQNKNCILQMGGSDQWGNITAGTELIRKKIRGEAFGLTTKLITKADGTKFGKTESGNIWLDAKKTSPYAFYQFWLNAGDGDVKNYMRIFSLSGKEEIEELEKQHNVAPHLRSMQKALAKEITIRVHNQADFNKAVEISEIFFNGTAPDLQKLSAYDYDSVHQSLGQNAFVIRRNDLQNGIPVLDLLATSTSVFPSKGEARKMMQANGLSLNKVKISDATLSINTSQLLCDKFLLFQKGKKNYYLLKAE